jgi:hypothetical protein
VALDGATALHNARVRKKVDTMTTQGTTLFTAKSAYTMVKLKLSNASFSPVSAPDIWFGG